MGVAGAYVGRAPRSGKLALAGGLCVTAAWFFPWVTMHFGISPDAGLPSSPVSESPYALAAQAGGWPTAYVLLLVGLALVGVGAYVQLTRRGALSRGSTALLALVAGALVAATYSALGLMAVPQIIGGQHAPGVYLVPGWGGALMLAGLGLVAAACVQAWRRP